MGINVGDIVQSNKYASSNRPGKKMLVLKIQNDTEEEHFQVIGLLLNKDGRPQKKTQAIKFKDLIL
jgi:hypothetical protein